MECLEPLNRSRAVGTIFGGFTEVRINPNRRTAQKILVSTIVILGEMWIPVRTMPCHMPNSPLAADED